MHSNLGTALQEGCQHNLRFTGIAPGTMGFSSARKATIGINGREYTTPA